MCSSTGAVEFVLELVAGRGVAGDLGDGGPAVLAQLNIPVGIAAARAGLVVADSGNRVRHIDFGVISTVAGSGAADFRRHGRAGTIRRWPVVVFAVPTRTVFRRWRRPCPYRSASRSIAWATCSWLTRGTT